MNKKNDVYDVLFKAEYLKISGIEWIDEDDCPLACMPTQIEFDDGFLLKLPRNYLELSDELQSNILHYVIESYLSDLSPDSPDIWPADFDVKLYGLTLVGTDEDDEDDEDLDDIKPYQPVCHLEALLSLDSITDDAGNEFVLLPKTALLEVINSRKFNQ